MDAETLIKVIFLLVLLIFDFNVQVASKLTQVVQTHKGPVQGIVLSTVAKHMRYSAFKGIPYAKPPVGSLRFKPPVEIESWQNTRNCEKEGEMCIQKELFNSSISGSENCLFLNIYTPMTNFRQKRQTLKAVIVWIHGGAYQIGSGNQVLYGPDFLIEADVVVVTLNYRLSAFGFLALNHPDALGNAGLKDQTLALRWIQKSIKNFGGDPNKITLTGHSAGAASVDYHILSDLSKGLFQRSISMSGSPVSFWGVTTSNSAEDQAYALGTLLNNGRNVTNSEELLGILRNASATDILLKTAELPSLLSFIPSLENPNIGKNQDTFLTKCYYEQYITGNYSQQPHMMGFVSEEALGYLTRIKSYLMLIKFWLLNFVEGHEPLSSIISKTIDEQFSPNVSTSSLERLVQLLSDIFIVTGIDLKQQLMSNTSSQPIYYYRNSFDAKNESFHQIVANVTVLNGTAHTDDVFYIFYGEFMKTFPINPSSRLSITRNRMVKLWTNFAKYGNPTPDGTRDELLNITWPDSRLSGAHLEISNKLTVKNTRPISETVSLFEKFVITTLPVQSGCNSSNT